MSTDQSVYWSGCSQKKRKKLVWSLLCGWFLNYDLSSISNGHIILTSAREKPGKMFIVIIELDGQWFHIPTGVILTPQLYMWLVGTPSRKVGKTQAFSKISVNSLDLCFSVSPDSKLLPLLSCGHAFISIPELPPKLNTARTLCCLLALLPQRQLCNRHFLEIWRIGYTGERTGLQNCSPEISLFLKIFPNFSQNTALVSDQIA